MGTLNTHANLYRGEKGRLKLIAYSDSYKNFTVNGVQTLPNFGYDVKFFGLNFMKRKRGKRVHRI